jgi:hypothetical protein
MTLLLAFFQNCSSLRERTYSDELVDRMHIGRPESAAKVELVSGVGSSAPDAETMPTWRGCLDEILFFKHIPGGDAPAGRVTLNRALDFTPQGTAIGEFYLNQGLYTRIELHFKPTCKQGYSVQVQNAHGAWGTNRYSVLVFDGLLKIRAGDDRRLHLDFEKVAQTLAVVRSEEQIEPAIYSGQSGLSAPAPHFPIRALNACDQAALIRDCDYQPPLGDTVDFIAREPAPINDLRHGPLSPQQRAWFKTANCIRRKTARDLSFTSESVNWNSSRDIRIAGRDCRIVQNFTTLPSTAQAAPDGTKLSPPSGYSAVYLHFACDETERRYQWLEPATQLTASTDSCGNCPKPDPSVPMDTGNQKLRQASVPSPCDTL